MPRCCFSLSSRQVKMYVLITFVTPLFPRSLWLRGTCPPHKAAHKSRDQGWTDGRHKNEGRGGEKRTAFLAPSLCPLLPSFPPPVFSTKILCGDKEKRQQMLQWRVHNIPISYRNKDVVSPCLPFYPAKWPVFPSVLPQQNLLLCPQHPAGCIPHSPRRVISQSASWTPPLRPRYWTVCFSDLVGAITLTR